MNEKDIIKRLNEKTEEIGVPDSLKPDNIMDTIRNRKKEKRTTKYNSRKIYAFVSAAAVLFLVLLAAGRQGYLKIDTENTAKNVSGSGNTEYAAEGMQSADMVRTGNVDSYNDVYKVLNKAKSAYMSETAAAWGFSYEEMGNIDTAKYANALEDGAATGTAYSRTNVQTEGIDEADIVKTDGSYIYYVDSDMQCISIYSVNKENTEKLTNLYVSDIGNIRDIYIDSDMLIVEGSAYRDDKYQTVISKYDIKDRKKPEFKGSFTQEGESVQTRKTGNIIYLVTTVYCDLDNINRRKPETFIPYICGNMVPVDSIYIPDETEGTRYTVISSVDVTQDVTMLDTASILGFGGEFYMGNDSMYLYRTSYEGRTVTEIKKIDYKAGDIGAVVSGRVPGAVRDTFAINEYHGYLRIMTTSYDDNSANNVFILDGELKTVGSIEGLAKGERIYAARYMGDTAYFVTYRETDPLFSVDLSDPANPKVMGELKIPGFSEYLHYYGDGKMLGIGLNQIINKEGYTEDIVKLSMFDISDPYNVTEESVYNIDATYSQALYDYKAVMIDTDKNIFGFVTTGYDNTGCNAFYRVYTYENGSFKEVIRHKIDNADNAYGIENIRAVYIGNYVYIVGTDGINIYGI